MAEVLNPCSARSKGEQRLAHRLAVFDDSKLLLGFTIDFIPGCREIDILLVHESLGVYVVEVKAVGLNSIKSVSGTEWVIEGRDGTESPLRQAYAQFEGLKLYWRARMRSQLFPVGVTACLPDISRSEWLRAFPEDYPNSIAKGLIFQDDLYDAETLRDCLKRVMINPGIRASPIRSGIKPEKMPPLPQELVADIRSLFVKTRRQEPGLSDRRRLESIESRVNKDLLQEFPPGEGVKAVFTGHPGTGKTFRLLSIGVAHAYKGQKVLFACFNKTLASDVRRVLSFNQKLNLSDHRPDVVDVFQLATRVFDIYGLELDANSPEEWGKMVVDEIKEKKLLLDSYNTILIDEAHDMLDWQLELIRLHAERNSTICLALGKGQELYRDDSGALRWLEEVSSDKEFISRPLRRNFRNTKAQYFAALAFHEAWPDKFQKINAVYGSVFSGRSTTSELLDFGREGEPLTYIPLPVLPGEYDDFGANQDSLLSAEYELILEKELDGLLAEGANPDGLLVLVPNNKSLETTWAQSALNRIINKRDGTVALLDYTLDKKRRVSALNHEIRLCTFHSSRGLEGERVVIFGFEKIESLAEETNVKPENLGFIALSRALFRTVVVVRTNFTRPVHSLLKKILTAASS